MAQPLDRGSAGDRAALIAAASDYRWLLDRGYPERPALSMVGDRYRLDRADRLTLFRGISSQKAADRRRARRWAPTTGDRPGNLAVDGYNVLFTILNYRAGRPCFLSADGFLRDAGDQRGRISPEARFDDLVHELCAYLRGLDFRSVQVWLDRPVSRSGEHAARIRAAMSAAGVPGTVEVCDSADFGVKHASADIIATADTAVIDASPLPCFDLARAYLEARHGATFLDLAVSRSPKRSLPET